MKHSQTVGKGGVKGLSGFLIIIAAVAAIYALNFVLSVLTRLGLNFLIGSLLFWGLGIGLALFLFYRFALLYQYELSDAKFVISRVYIHNPRPMLEIYPREIVFLGPPEEARRRYPNASTQRAITRRAPDPVTALVYVRDKAPHLVLIEPDQDIKTALLAVVKK